MIDKIGHIKNPLSIIAIFAGIAEISGTVVLPFINESSQSKYVWFLMLFPTMLVVIFFYVLWHKPRVLYAPSDYTDETNFVRMMEPATYFEVEAKAQKEFAALSSDTDNDLGPTPSGQTPIDDLPTLSPDYSTRGKTLREYMVAEDRVFSLLSHEFPALKRNIAVSKSGKRSVFDGIVENGKELIIFEVKVFKYLTQSNIMRSASQFAETVNGALPLGGTNLRLILVVAVREEAASKAKIEQTEVIIGGRKIELRLMNLHD